MFETICSMDWFAVCGRVAAFCQIATPLFAGAIAVATFRYTKRQNALALINQNNSLANLVNTTVISSPEAQQALGRLHDVIVGCPDDAILFMYLNYVHNTFRTFRIGAISAQVWTDTLGACGTMMSRLRRDQVERLLSRGYEAGFRIAVLARYDALHDVRSKTVASDIHPASRPRLALAA